LVIGAHSLSELDWTTFLRLFRERGLQVTCRVLRDAPLATQRGTRREEAQFDSAARQWRPAFPLWKWAGRQHPFQIKVGWRAGGRLANCGCRDGAVAVARTRGPVAPWPNYVFSHGVFRRTL